jgi:hypothetical protein
MHFDQHACLDRVHFRRCLNAPSVADCMKPVFNVTLSGSTCSFTYTPAVSQRNGLPIICLGLGKSGGSIQPSQKVHVNNVP